MNERRKAERARVTIADSSIARFDNDDDPINQDDDEGINRGFCVCLKRCWRFLKRESLVAKAKMVHDLDGTVQNLEFAGKYSASHGRRFQELERTFIVSAVSSACTQSQSI